MTRNKINAHCQEDGVYVLVHPKTKERIIGTLAMAKVVLPLTHAYVTDIDTSPFFEEFIDENYHKNKQVEEKFEVYEFEEFEDISYTFVTATGHTCSGKEITFMTEEEYNLHASLFEVNND